MNLLNPFGLTGWQAMLSTGIVCFTVAVCVGFCAAATVRATESICDAVRDVVAYLRDTVKDVADAFVTVHSGKAK